MNESKKDVKFEDALKRLEEIVGKLEEGELELEKSIALFEEGVGMAKACQKKLDEAEKKVGKLTRDSGGGLTTEPLEETGGDESPL